MADELFLLKGRLDNEFTVVDEDVFIRGSSHLKLSIAADDG